MQGAKGFRDKGGNSSYSKRKPGKITTSSIGKYRDVLTKFQVAFLQMFSKRTMAKYDYTLAKINFSTLGWFRFVFFDIPFELARMLAWLGREAFLDRSGRDLPAERVVSRQEALS